MSEPKATKNKLSRMGDFLREIAAYDLNGVDMQVVCYLASITVDTPQDGLQQDQCRVSLRRLQDQTGVTGKAIRKSLARLVDGGFIAVYYRGSSYATHSNVYNVHFKPDRAKAIETTLRARGETEWKLPAQTKPVTKRTEGTTVPKQGTTVPKDGTTVLKQGTTVPTFRDTNQGPASATNISETKDTNSSVMRTEADVSAQVADSSDKEISSTVFPLNAPVSKTIESGDSALELSSIDSSNDGEKSMSLNAGGGPYSQDLEAQEPDHIDLNNIDQNFSDSNSSKPVDDGFDGYPLKDFAYCQLSTRTACWTPDKGALARKLGLNL